MGSKGKSFFLKKKNLVHRATVHSLGIFDWKVFSIFTARERTSEVDLGIFFFFYQLVYSGPTDPFCMQSIQSNLCSSHLVSSFTSSYPTPTKTACCMYVFSISISISTRLGSPRCAPKLPNQKGKKTIPPEGKLFFTTLPKHYHHHPPRFYISEDRRNRSM